MTSIGWGVFGGCSSLQSIEIPNSVTSIGKCAFYGCSQLKSIHLSDNLMEIGYGTFEDCSSLESITIPSSVETISQYLYAKDNSDDTIRFIFGNCTALKHINIEYNSSILQFGYDDRRYIGEGRFYPFLVDDWTNTLETVFIDRRLNKPITYLNSLKVLTIGENLGYLGVEIENSSNLTKIISYARTPPSGISCTDKQYINVEVKVPKGTLESYKNAKGWENFWNIEELSEVVMAESIELDSERVELTVDGVVQLLATVLPEETSDKTVVWSSSSPDIASVSENGLVTAMAVGSAVITVTCGNVSAQCVIEVKGSSGINDILSDPDIQFDVYNLQGIKIKSSCGKDDIRNLPSGIYIISGNGRHFKIKI